MPFASTVGLGVSTFIDTDFLDDRLVELDLVFAPRMPAPASSRRSSRTIEGTTCRVRKEPLWLLQGLDIEDKHRTLNLVALGLMGRLHTSVDHPEFGLTGATGFMPFADGAVILRRLRNYGGHDTSLPLLIIDCTHQTGIYLGYCPIGECGPLLYAGRLAAPRRHTLAQRIHRATD